MRRMTRFCIVLLLLVLPSRLVGAQDSADVITVTGLYVGGSGSEAEGQNVLIPCHISEVWGVAPDSLAFTALTQAYSSAETMKQLTKYGEIFVEVRGRYTAYGTEEESHEDGVFEVTEFVRYSTAAADITACEWTCEREYGANSPICLAQVDGQCGSTRNSCVSGDYQRHYERDTATHYRWECVGSYGGDNAVCMAPKVGLHGTEADEQE